MSLEEPRTFKINDLARIALGSEELTNERLSALLKLLLVLLHKLNCHNETVKIKGLAAKCLEKLSSDCLNFGQYNFQFENVQSFEEKFHLLEELQRKTQDIDTRLEQHFEQIRKRHISSATFSAKVWHIYSSPTEDLGAMCVKQNRRYWFLIENAVFNAEVRRNVVPQALDKLKQFEEKIESMQKQLWDLTQISNETPGNLQYVKCIIKDTEELRSSIIIREKEFCDAVAEVDDMLRCKLHRVTVPALKKFLEPRFRQALKHLQALQQKDKKCPPAKPLTIEDGKTCLSCSRYGQQKKFKHLTSIDADVKCCCCNLLKDASVIEKIYRMKQFDSADTRSSRKSESGLRYENGFKTADILKSIARKSEDLKPCLVEKEHCERRKVQELGPIF